MPPLDWDAFVVTLVASCIMIELNQTMPTSWSTMGQAMTGMVSRLDPRSWIYIWCSMMTWFV